MRLPASSNRTYSFLPSGKRCLIAKSRTTILFQNCSLKDFSAPVYPGISPTSPSMAYSQRLSSETVLPNHQWYAGSVDKGDQSLQIRLDLSLLPMILAVRYYKCCSWFIPKLFFMSNRSQNLSTKFTNILGLYHMACHGAQFGPRIVLLLHIAQWRRHELIESHLLFQCSGLGLVCSTQTL